MDWITENLAVGEASDVTAVTRQTGLAALPVQWLVNVAQEITYDTPWMLGGLKYGGVIASRPITPLVAAIVALLKAGQKVLVHCGAGMNRSPAVAICVLMALGQTEEQARAMVAMRQGVVPTEEIISAYKAEAAAK
jgi:protein-tyrosine phosphatase